MPNAIFFHTIARYFYIKKIPVVPKLLRLLIFILYNSRIPYQVEIGKGTYFAAKGIGVALNDKVSIGENCSIGHNVVIAGKAPFINAPQIGSNVWIGPGAVLLGPVIIEDDVVIGANAVVTKSVKKGSIVAGVPAKVIGNTSSLNYDPMGNQSLLDGHAQYM